MARNNGKEGKAASGIYMAFKEKKRTGMFHTWQAKYNTIWHD